LDNPYTTNKVVVHPELGQRQVAARGLQDRRVKDLTGMSSILISLIAIKIINFFLFGNFM
ncbi:hypothetical protein, partial [Salmonella sp. s57402]|uniref:hypothetical protein n=1 Tax=Salmonella sp. s57402 TaxID=3159695 RepID=UPI0039810758